MGRVVKYSPCPECRKRGKDSRGDNLVNYDDGGCHCFSCGYHENGKFWHSFEPKQEILNESKVLPPDFSREIPTAAWKWLLQYGLPYSYWKDRCGYSEKFRRLIFLVGNPQAPSFSLGRLIGEPASDKERKWFVWGDCARHAELLAVANSPITVVVEDLISAHKVAQVYESLPLFGTYPHPVHMYALRDGSSRPIVLWLDKDQKGSVKTTVARIQLLTNRPVYVQFADQDPKLCSFDFIKGVNPLSVAV